MDAIEKDVLDDLHGDFTERRRATARRWCSRSTKPGRTASRRRRWIRRSSSSAAASTSGAWPRPTCASWAPTPSRSRCPGFKDPEKAKELIGTTAQLEFRIVDDTDPRSSRRPATSRRPPPAESGITLARAEGFPAAGRARDREALLAYAQGKAPADREVLLECMRRRRKKGELRQVPHLPGGEDRPAHRREPRRRADADISQMQRARGEHHLRRARRARLREAHREERRPAHGHRPRRQRPERRRASTRRSPAAAPASPWAARWRTRAASGGGEDARAGAQGGRAAGAGDHRRDPPGRRVPGARADQARAAWRPSWAWRWSCLHGHLLPPLAG